MGRRPGDEEAVAETGVKTCVCFECRYSSQFLATKAVIDAGLLGTLHYGEVDYYHGIGPWYGQYRWNTKRELGGSALLTAGCHALDALLLCMGSDVEEVTSYATQSANPIFSAYEYPTTSTTILKFRNGSVGKCAAVVDCLQPYYFHTHLVGSEGSLLDNKFHSQKLAGLNRHAWSQLSMKMLDSGDVGDHPVPDAVPGVLRCARSRGRTCRSRVSPTRSRTHPRRSRRRTTVGCEDGQAGEDSGPKSAIRGVKRRRSRDRSRGRPMPRASRSPRIPTTSNS